MSELALEPVARKLPAEPTSEILTLARERAAAEGLPFSGSIYPVEAWQLFISGLARFIDVRTAEERKFVGHVPGSVHVPWATGLSLQRNVRFIRDLEKQASRDEGILLLCRSGKRSAAAATEATKAGFKHVFNIVEGFEGEINEQQQRGASGGWRHAGLPWVQD